MDGYLPLRTTVYEDKDGEQRAFPHRESPPGSSVKEAPDFSRGEEFALCLSNGFMR